MERRNKELRQSSLPSSLIPHLYSRPQQDDTLPTAPFPTLPLPASTRLEDETVFSERTELPSMRTSFTLPPVASSFATSLPPVETHRSPSYLNYDTRQPPSADHNLNLQTVSPVDIPASGLVRSMGSLSLPSHVPSHRYSNPIYSDPQYHATRTDRMFHGLSHGYPLPAAQDAAHPRDAWREGEAGPSSLAHVPYESARIRGRRGSSQPAQLSRQAEAFNLRGDASDGDGDVYSTRGRDSYPGAMGHSTQSGSLYSSWPEPFQGSATHASQLGSDLTASQLTTGYSQFPLTSVSASHGWAGTSTGSGFGDYPTGYSPSSVSDASSEGRPDDDGDETYTTSQKGKKRRRDSDVRDDSTRKSRNPRKTAVACNFCRGRKLRCNGAKPACSNCMVRKFQCEYVPVQRRRGPGKAPKGTKSKKASAAARSEASTSLPPPGDHGSGAMAETTETGSMSLETFSFPSSSSSSPPKGGPSRRRKTRTPSVDSEADKRY